MKTTDAFKTTISNKLQEMAEADPLFAVSLKKENKNIDDCITYILNAVQKCGCNGFADDEIFGMAAHYYDEDNIDIGNPIQCKVVVNHTIELSEDELQEAKEAARAKVIAEESERLKKKSSTKRVEAEVQQGTLF